MNTLQAALLGVVEGATEFLPVSSTGHLILVGEALGAHDEAAKAFEVVIQLGAILAVVVHYRSLLLRRTQGIFRRDPEAIQLLLGLVIAFIPSGLLGFAIHKTVKRLLFGPMPVAIALVVGGIGMIAIEKYRKKAQVTGLEGLSHVTLKRALVIGLGQCVSLWPGSSRSMCTIVAGQLTGLSTATAADFSFLLALPTLGAATIYDLYKHRSELLGAQGSAVTLAVGMGVSFVVAWAVIAAFVRYLGKRGLEPFGYYRILIGAVVFWLCLRS